EEHHGQADHDEDHHGGEPCLFPARPGDLAHLAPHFLHELQRRDTAARRGRRFGVRIHFRLFRQVGHFKLTLQTWQGRRDSNPRPSVLETDALPAELHPFNVVSGAFAVSRLSRRNTSNRLADPPAFWSAQAKQYSRSSYFRILATTPAPTVR